MNALFSFGGRDQSNKEGASVDSSEKLIDIDTQSQTNPFDDLSDEDDPESDQNLHSAEEVGGGNPFGEDPLINDMERHWQELSDLTESSLTDPFALQEFKDHLRIIAETIEKELKQSASLGHTSECLEFFLSENMLEKAYLFSTRQRLYCSEVRLSLLNFCTSVLSCPGPPLFIHQQFLRPLTRLLRACEMAHDQWLDSNLVALLQQICILIQENDSLLDLFFTVGKGQVPSKFLVFTLLVQYMHNLSEAGMRARDAMLLCLSIAGRSPHSSLCDFIITDTEFCQVLATGLSATYSQLPQVVSLHVDDWESPLASFEQSILELKRFMQALSYCNSVLQMAPLLVSQVCVRLIKKGFLQQVLGPALLQNSIDAVATATGYLTLFLQNISNVQLMRIFLQFILTVKYDGHFVLNSLIQNIASDFHQLSSITLELFNVLLDLNCEDVLLELILKHLLPGSHVMVSQIPTIASRDMYGVASRKFLTLVPTCCIKAEKMLVDSLFNSPQSSRSSSPPPSQTSPVRVDSSTVMSSVSPAGKPTSRVRKDSTSSTCSTTSLTSSIGLQQNHTTQQINNSDPIVVPAPLTRQQSSLTELINSSIMFNVLTPEAAFQSYLTESHAAIDACARACKCWSNEYDSCVISDGEEEKSDSAVSLTRNDMNDDGSIAGETDSHSTPKLNVPTSLLLNERNGGTESTNGFDVSPNISPSLSPRHSRRSLRKRLEKSMIRFNDSTGLFLKTMFEKLAHMFQNPPIINILILKVITRLSQYPQPLLRSLLLNHQLVLKPGVPNLFNVLQDLKQTADRIDREREAFEVRIARARKTMIYKAAVKNGEVDAAIDKKISALMLNSDMPRSDSRMSDQSEQDQQTAVSSAEKKDDTPPFQRRRAKTEGSRSLEKLRKRKKLKVTVNMVYAILLFSELLKELSALSLEHSIINPELLELEPNSTT